MNNGHAERKLEPLGCGVGQSQPTQTWGDGKVKCSRSRLATGRVHPSTINGGALPASRVLGAWDSTRANVNAIPPGLTTGHLLHRASREGCDLDARRATSKRCERPGTVPDEEAHARLGVWGFALGSERAAVVPSRFDIERDGK
jgi:hypothetical protein